MFKIFPRIRQLDKNIQFRIIFLVFLIIVAQFQLVNGKKLLTDFKPKIIENWNDTENDEFNIFYNEYNNSYSNKLSMPLPLISKTVPTKDAQWAEKFLRLPVWSSGYNNCSSENSEVSCYELFRAAKAIEEWETMVKNKKTFGYVYVYVKEEEFPDRLSMLYHGLQIAIITKRNLITNRAKYEPLELPSIIENAKGDEDGFKLITNYSFGCSDLSHKNPYLKFSNASWPQVLYTHNAIAPKLRESFGFHAAYFMGNYLFGTSEIPKDNCYFPDSSDIIEGWTFTQENIFLNPVNYYQFLPRCGCDLDDSIIIVRNPVTDIHFINKHKYAMEISDSPSDMVCGLRSLMSGKRIIQTFGSRLGFWATAMQGSKGSFINVVDHICVNMTNSQQGSIWHTYFPYDRDQLVYRSNNWFHICGPNIDDARLYIDYLLW